MRHLFIVDPLDGLNPRKDTTVVFMREAAGRGHEVCSAEMAGLSVGAGGVPQARFVTLEPRETDDWFQTGLTGVASLADFDVVWQRKDPPYDLDYFFVTHLLSLAPPATLVVNEPLGLREVTEKMFVLRYPDLTPPTVISRDMGELAAFRDSLGGEMILKPLDGCGGEGVFHLRKGDPNTGAILEVATAHGTVFQIGQAYVPDVRDGDKRIILVEGEPVGAVLRVPEAGEVRANFHAGGSAKATTITEREREICTRLGPELRRLGIVFAGIDVIGEYMTECNVTSPTGVQEINALDGVQLEKNVLDAVENRLRQRRSNG